MLFLYEFKLILFCYLPLLRSASVISPVASIAAVTLIATITPTIAISLAWALTYHLNASFIPVVPNFRIHNWTPLDRHAYYVVDCYLNQISNHIEEYSLFDWEYNLDILLTHEYLWVRLLHLILQISRECVLRTLSFY